MATNGDFKFNQSLTFYRWEFFLAVIFIIVGLAIYFLLNFKRIIYIAAFELICYVLIIAPRRSALIADRKKNKLSFYIHSLFGNEVRLQRELPFSKILECFVNERLSTRFSRVRVMHTRILYSLTFVTSTGGGGEGLPPSVQQVIRMYTTRLLT